MVFQSKTLLEIMFVAYSLWFTRYLAFDGTIGENIIYTKDNVSKKDLERVPKPLILITLLRP